MNQGNSGKGKGVVMPEPTYQETHELFETILERDNDIRFGEIASYLYVKSEIDSMKCLRETVTREDCVACIHRSRCGYKRNTPGGGQC